MIHVGQKYSNIKSDGKPPSSPPPKEGDDPKKITTRDKDKKRNSPKGKEPVKPGHEEPVKPGLRKRNPRDPEEPTKKLPERITDSQDIQIKPMKDEVSTCHSHCGPSSIDANLLTCFSFLKSC